MPSLRLFVSYLMFLAAAVSWGQSNVCPNNSPTNRPSGVTPSEWKLSKVAAGLHSPFPNLLILVSHRGNWEFCPENTLESFQAAWDIGAEAAEMDVRLSAPGSDPNTGVSYPNGEVFLSHDYDIRGEAPMPTGSSQTSNYIYSLIPADLTSRNMADRHGKILKDSSGNYLHMATLTQLLQSMVARANALGLVVANGSPRVSGWKYMSGGMFLVVDVKGYVSEGKNGKNQYDTFLEAVNELYAYETANQIDLGDAVSFKVQYKDFATYSAQNLLNSVTNTSSGYVDNLQIPRLIFIVFPADFCIAPADQPGSPCVAVPPAQANALNDYRDHYLDPRDNSLGLMAVDWQYRNEGDVLATYVSDSGWNGWGRAMFLASNNFSDGVRNSGGDCKNNFSDKKAVPAPSPTAPPINASFCVSDPIQRWSSASLDYLVPSFGPSHATSVTTDLYQNAVNYLIAIGQNDTTPIQ